ncbi:MAG TPA: hypothetical protein VMB50_07655 [Myxococcales bacterium]|nr:hypothetical protein [Myxococcales bacterium]
MKRATIPVGLAGLALAGWAVFASPAAWGAVAASWLFATGVVLGCVVLSAATRVVGARWADDLLPLVRRVVSFLPWSFAVLVALVAAGPRWLPWVHGVVSPERRWWLNYPSFAARELIAGAVLFLLALRQARAPRSAPATGAVVFLLVYVAVMTLWATDFVMALDREWVDPMLGGYLFMGGFLGGTAAASLAAVRRPGDTGLRYDVGKLLFGLAVFWAYLTFVQTLVIWYGDLPEETGFVLARLVNPWRSLGLAAAALVFVAPFFLLLREQGKRHASVLSVCAAGILAGLWIEAQLLVLPSLSPSLTPEVLAGAIGSTAFLAERMWAAA